MLQVDVGGGGDDDDAWWWNSCCWWWWGFLFSQKLNPTFRLGFLPMAWIISSFLSMGVMPHVTHVENGCGDGGHFDLANWDGISRKRIFGFWGKKTTHELEKKKRHTEKCVFANFSGWWFQTFFIFTPIWGRFPIWLIFFRWVGSTTNQFTLRNTCYLDLRPLRNKVFGNFWKALFSPETPTNILYSKRRVPIRKIFRYTPPKV